MASTTPTHEIRIFGDPVLKAKTPDVTDIDGKLVRLADEMVQVMYDAPGLGLAAPQVGVQKRFFVYDLGDGTGPHTIVNPVIVESRGEWLYDEGCLSIPKLYVEILRPKELLVTGYDLDGNELQIEADEILGRVIQHELDHLDGVLMFERMTPDQRKQAMTEWRRLRAEPEPEPKKRRIRLT
jgi:peptide deformylase